MKKFLVLALVLLFVQSSSEAKDYAKRHLQQMKKNQEYRIQNTYFNDYAPENPTIKMEIKDPKLIKLGGYEDISVDKMKNKFAKDAIEYKKVSEYLASRKVNEYHMQAYSHDFYRVYRIAERIIRANGLDFMNWRITLDSTQEFNAYNSETNNITVNSGLLDTFKDNDDALAQVIGHEIAHGLLGHSKRKAKYDAKVKRTIRMDSALGYYIAKKRANKVSRDMEYEADVEGAKLAVKAGYNLAEAREVMAFLNTLYYAEEVNQTHPDALKRLKNFEQNRKYFMESEWKKQGLYNLYKTEVLKCEKSSNRNSIIIPRGKTISYSPETYQDMCLRYGYCSYLSGDFKDAIKYFKDYLKTNKGNYAVYLYVSYAYECIYRQTGNESALESAKEFAGYAKTIAPDNKQVKEQILAL